MAAEKSTTAMMTSAFTLLHDKNMLAPASASSWCPTMDLLALATTDGQLSLARLDWNKQGGERENKLWTTNPDSAVTALGWRPDGRVLVSGHADGSIQLYHVEDGEILHHSRPHAAAVTSLHWQDAPASDATRSSAAYQSVVSRFALPTTTTKSGGAGRGGGLAGAKGKEGGGGGAGSRTLFDHFNPPAKLSVLVGGDARGVVTMSAHGVFPIGVADVAAAGLGMLGGFFGEGEGLVESSSSSSFSVQHASLSPDMARVLVAFTAAPSSSSSSSSSAAFVATAAAPLLAARSREMCEIASHGSQCVKLANESCAEIDAASTAWSKAFGDFSSKMRALRERLATHWRHSDEFDPAEPTPPSVEEHFLSLLATGTVNDAMEEFFTHEFQPSAARRVAKTVDAAANAAHAALLETILPTAEAAVLRLAELQALARWRERVSAVGLSEVAVDAALDAAERHCLAAGVAIRAATAHAARLRAFFVLILRTQRVIMGENPDGGGEDDDANALPALNPGLLRELFRDGVDADALGAHLKPPSPPPLSAAAADRDDAQDAAERLRRGRLDRGDDDDHRDREDAETDARSKTAAARDAFLAAVRGAAAAAGFGGEDAASASDRRQRVPPLWSAAAELRGACVAALDGPAAAMSASLRFGPAFAVVASGVDAAGAAAPPKISHGGWSDDGDAETLVFHAGGDVVQDGEEESRQKQQRQHVGTLTLRRGVPERAMSLRVEEGREVVDARAYTEGRVLVLTQPAGGDDAAPGAAAASAAMIDPSELPGGGEGASVEAGGGTVARPRPPPGCVPEAGVLDASAARARRLPGLVATAPLAVGPAKGLAAVLVGSRRIVLLDLEEDECDEDDDEEEE